ncbi:YrbL family protein [uncultured Psychroserpens sp.]|uniref:YrbL family protein n=1 Tax=uncultured Psychroserpens sp. TaxID=255436 RepID=UPI002626DE60|nr:YrbL family protein [uncultured Psychroserpens sp.]
MIIINDEDYIAEGFARKCYLHPDNNQLCIKIGKPEVEEVHLYKEIKYYEKISKKDKNKFDYPFYAMYHGTVDTNYGEGFVYDLVKDETTLKISKTLLDYLLMDDSPFSDDQLFEAVQRLKHQMIKHRVFVGDCRARNICCQVLKDGSIQLVIIDGIGHRDFLPLADWFGYFAKKKVERRLVKSRLQSIEAQREYIKEVRIQYDTTP